jgi:hypothetical protein
MSPDTDDFDRIISGLTRKIEELQEKAATGGETREALDQALEGLRTALEELHVSE